MSRGFGSITGQPRRADCGRGLGPRAAGLPAGSIGQRGPRGGGADGRGTCTGGLARAREARRAGYGETGVAVVAARPRASFIAAVERADATPDRDIGWGRTGEPGRTGGGADEDAGRG